MIRNFIRTTLRNLHKNKTSTIINLSGLCLGIVSALVIFAVVRFEYSFDNFHDDPERIFRVVTFEDNFGEESYQGGVPFPMPKALRQDFEEFEYLTIVDGNMTTPSISYQRPNGQQVRFEEDKFAFVEPDYFRIFKYTWLQGDPETVLNEPNSVVLSLDVARKYFGHENPLGKRLSYNNESDFQLMGLQPPQEGSRVELLVTGVFETPPSNTDLPFEMLARFSFDERRHSKWNSVSSAVHCYVKLAKHIEPAQVEARFHDFIAKYRSTEAAQRHAYHLQPLSELHFDVRFENFNHTTNKNTLGALLLIGLALLVAACINFVNLNTALAVYRSKEVGVRKALGSGRGRIIVQFMTETSVVTAVALILAIAIAEIASHQLRPLLEYELDLNLIRPASLGFLLVLFVVVTMGAGYYPALYVSKFSPVQALRNRLGVRYKDGLGLRKGLVIVQFFIAQALILCTFIIGNQIKYLVTADMGIDTEAIVETELPTNAPGRLNLFKEQMLQHSSIRLVSFSNSGTVSTNVWDSNYRLTDGDEIKENRIHVKMVDVDFLDTYGLQLLAGRSFRAADSSNGFLVNQLFAAQVGYTANYNDLLGKHVRMWGNDAPIIGVVKNFNTTSLHEELKPTVLLMKNQYWLAGIKVSVGEISQALTAIAASWQIAFPEYQFKYKFLDDSIADFYNAERRLGHLMNIFTIIAIAIGCLGLFGLTSYMAAQRTKEIGVRKVLGAGVSSILALFSKDFAVLLFISFSAAAPFAYLLMHRWLQDFAYRIALGPGVFLFALAASFLLAFLAIGGKTVQAALANPVDSLRNE